MPGKLPVKQGLSAPAVTTIPEKWDKMWFRNFITHFLVNADVRNAKTTAGIAINPVNVSGNPVGGSGSSGGSIIIGIAPIPPNTVLGNITAASAEPSALSQTQLTSLINNFTSALSGSVPASAGGTTNFLRADGTFAVPPGTTVGANPSASVGLSAVNGSATTYMRSDGAPALSQSIVPTWTGAHTFNAGLTATTVTATTLNATSDPRLKKKFHRIHDCGDILDNIKGYRFTWKADDTKSMGVNAEEVHQVAPELVAMQEDIRSVNYNGLIAVLIEEVKSLRKRVAELEAT